MIVDKIKDFIGQCPYLDELVPINANFLHEDVVSYCIEASPSSIILESYIDGSSERQLNFIFSSKEMMSDFDDTNMENLNFYEHFTKWIEEQNRLGNLPKLEYPLFAQKIEVTSPGYVIQLEPNKGQYAIKMRLKYFDKN